MADPWEPEIDFTHDWATFEGAYGDIDHETQCRARFRGIYYGVLLVSYGGDVGDQAITEAGRWALRHSLA